MICVSIQHESVRQTVEILKKVEMAEIRLDLCDFDDEQIQTVFQSDTPLIATCRASDGNFRESERKLLLAIQAGARYADLEIEAPKSTSKRIAEACASWGTTLIRSFHDFEGTLSLEELKAIVDKCRHHDGDVVKIVTTAHNAEDAARVTELYKYYTPESLVAFAMAAPEQQEVTAALSEKTRLNCLRKGAPFSYAALDEGEATAPGQIPYSEMYRKVYGDRKSVDTGKIRIPASKSYAQRAIVAAALADGRSTLTGFTPCGDSLAALEVAHTLGAKIIRKRGTAGTTTLEIQGIAQRPSEPVINVGESGLLTRLMIPLAAELYSGGEAKSYGVTESSGTVRIEGRGTLLTRPLKDAQATMNALGATLSGETVPLTVQGPLKPGRIEIDGSKSSQLISGALMALPLCQKNSTLHIKNPTSIPYIYMTMDILRKFGIKLRSEMYGGREVLEQEWDRCTDIIVKIRENQRYKAAEMSIEADWSSAAVFLAAGAIFGETAIDGLDTTSLQADLTMLDLLMDAGASLSQLEEPTGLIVAKKSPLQAIGADLSNCPDLFPVVSVLCAFCQGKSVLEGTQRLIHKESNRADGILEMLMKMGVRVKMKDNSMEIWGESLASRVMNGRLLKGGQYSSYHDHRMVMALRLAELGASEPIEIDDTECVAKSFPEFNEIWYEYVRKKL